ncbi:unnamed protein product [Pedinophyceae sp. YPF-701]|nr:unnamed protein product [Pedinophyceae sp. YPF-701]
MGFGEGVDAFASGAALCLAVAVTLLKESLPKRPRGLRFVDFRHLKAVATLACGCSAALLVSGLLTDAAPRPPSWEVSVLLLSLPLLGAAVEIALWPEESMEPWWAALPLVSATAVVAGRRAVVLAAQEHRHDLPSPAPLALNAACATVALTGLAVIAVELFATPALPQGNTEPLLPENEEGRQGWRAFKRPKRTIPLRVLFGRALRFATPRTASLQLAALTSLLLVGVSRVINVLLPQIYAHIVDAVAALSHGGTPPPSAHLTAIFPPWQPLGALVAAYLGLLALQGGALSGTGLITNARTVLWLPINQASTRLVWQHILDQSLDLDLDFHLAKKTGELLRTMERGASSLQTVLSALVFNLGPAMLDLVVGCAYMAVALDRWIALIAFATLASYLPLTVTVTEWRTAIRREMNQLDNQRSGVVTECVQSWETVKLFTAEDRERTRYFDILGKFQAAERRMQWSLAALNAMQLVIVLSGVACGLVLCADRAMRGELTAGGLVLFLTLMAQMCTPLSWLGSYWRMLVRNLTDLESLVTFLDARPGVADAPGAHHLVLKSNSSVEFADVSFAYRPRVAAGGARAAPSSTEAAADGAEAVPTALQGVSFVIDSGQKLALVGHTGAGKSSVLRLLCRFYDPTRGVVKVGGTDVRCVTQASLRAHIGVVPQDTVLFHASILENIRYGRPDATDAECVAAAEAAALRAHVESRLPEGWATVVGERGLRLSGGEKQRVAFARAVLKRARVLVLDEATSALDSVTERQIQDALEALEPRPTQVVVAHRLSTVSSADTILVLDHGRVVQRGSHGELVAQAGIYGDMWARQLHAGTSSEWAEGRRSGGGGDSDRTDD